MLKESERRSARLIYSPLTPSPPSQLQMNEEKISSHCFLNLNHLVGIFLKVAATALVEGRHGAEGVVVENQAPEPTGAVVGTANKVTFACFGKNKVVQTHSLFS